jgi:hypothetical protein
MLPSGKWIELENFILSEVSMFSLICGSLTYKYIDTYLIIYMYMICTYSERENKIVLVSLSEGLNEIGEGKKMLENGNY